MAAKIIPDRVLEDDGFRRQLVVAMGEAVAQSMDESEWKKFAIRYNLEDKTTERYRFLRSLSFGDPDHEGMVVELIDYIFPNNPEAFFDLFDRVNVQNKLKRNYPNLITYWNGEDDSLIEAISYGVAEVDAVANVIDLGQYTRRIQEALPSDPHEAIGHTKDMLEATMRTIMDRRGLAVGKDADFPSLTTRCMTELGLIATSPPASEGERYVRKIASAAKTMIETANEYRNLAGTGHGRVVGKEVDVTSADASLVASSGLILAAWLLRRLADLS
jgi:hypothetical protein